MTALTKSVLSGFSALCLGLCNECSKDFGIK